MTLRENAVSGGVSAKIPKASRLLRHADFRLVYEQGRRHFSANFTAFYRANTSENAAPRIGYTVSRALGGAVDRNRMKRRLRDTVRRRLFLLPPCWEIVWNVRRALLSASQALIESEVERVFSKCKA